MLHTMDTSSFVNSFRRFISDENKPRHMYSDNGTNFVAGDKQIDEGIARWNHYVIGTEMAAERVEWHYNPPGAPHFGGAWERLVRSTKTGLYAALHGKRMTDEIFLTSLKEVQSMLNGRPLTAISNDVTDLPPITPRDILHPFSPRVGPADAPDFTTFGNKSRHRDAQFAAGEFWLRWRNEYMPGLIGRPKWNSQQRNLCVGDIVTVKDDNTVRDEWKNGRIVKTYASKTDGVVRNVDVRIDGKIVNRPAHRVSLLEGDTT